DDTFIGTTITADSLTGYSSRGNTGDVRVKPDLVAPGSFIDSVLAGTSSNYSFDGEGTSFATPHVTGLVASLLGMTIDPNTHLSWPAEAIKSIMLATAVDLGMPSALQGQGKADALLEHYDIDGGWYAWWWQNGGTGDLRYIDFNLPSPAAR